MAPSNSKPAAKDGVGNDIEVIDSTIVDTVLQDSTIETFLWTQAWRVPGRKRSRSGLSLRHTPDTWREIPKLQWAPPRRDDDVLLTDQTRSRLLAPIPATASQRPAMLDLINRLRNSEAQGDIDLPMIPVIGNQSVGKLSYHPSSNQFLASPFLVHRAAAQECKVTQANTPWTEGSIEQAVLMIAYDHFDRAAARAKEKMDWLLRVERAPATLNTHYYSDYCDKFLAEDYEQRALLAERMGISAKVDDLARLLPSNLLEVASGIMASIQGYFQVAYMRFVDTEPLAIDHEMVRRMERPSRGSPRWVASHE
ncbi:hypothetical protein F5J12DRAFT_891438 [Pisolithus orientalis]|uniref:uncharacterized protein n=1 Tax=Pisolithus orientalis TaxID=936130 RepID=UPI0022245A4B|nr:uncharacterized protein F5J12DRAFT_891438 [Pisolithus orientalis]KAI6010932.1 hypothetical protein F5J12DRAFT_891438 [Pisolithus orientalis]